MNDFLARRRQTFMSETLYDTTRLYELEGVVSSGEINPSDSLSMRATDACIHFYHRFQLWRLDYTAGVPLDELAPQLSEVIDALEKWEAVNVEYRRERRSLRKDIEVDLAVSASEMDRFDHYQELIQLTGLAVMLRDARSVRRIARAMKFSRGIDSLFEHLIRGYVDDPIEITSMDHEKPWRTLNDAFYPPTDEESIALVQKFCNKWYPAMKGLPWHDAHKRIYTENGKEMGRYCGYWAFEAGAVAYLLDFDDSSIDHMVYPKDLVAYGKAQRERNEWTSPLASVSAPSGDTTTWAARSISSVFQFSRPTGMTNSP